MRHTHLLAVAPTRTNSVISGAFSQGIEPIDSNYFVAKQAKGTYVRKNPVLEKLLCDRGVGPSIWERILDAKGSVQDLDCLTDEEKEIFKTAREVDQFELIKQASDRQQFICQGQSLNLFVDPESDPAYIMRLHLSAWKMGLKSLYYLKSSSLLTKKKTAPTQIVTRQDCPWCVRLKELLQSEGVPFVEITKEQAIQQNLWKEEYKTVPQLWLNGRHIGGYSDYVQLKQNTPEQTYVDCTACEA
jgi:ribonucleoside-diphosphate reductase alpha chain